MSDVVKTGLPETGTQRKAEDLSTYTDMEDVSTTRDSDGNITTIRKRKSCNRRFHTEWEEELLVVEDIIPGPVPERAPFGHGDTASNSSGVVCVLCGEHFTECRKFVIERHLNRRHPRASKFKIEMKRRLVHHFCLLSAYPTAGFVCVFAYLVLSDWDFMAETGAEVQVPVISLTQAQLQDLMKSSAREMQLKQMEEATRPDKIKTAPYKLAYTLAKHVTFVYGFCICGV